MMMLSGCVVPTSHVSMLTCALMCILCGLLPQSTIATHYSSQWAVHIVGGKDVADSIANKHGFVNLGEIFPDLYHFHHNTVAKRSPDPSPHHHKRLTQEPAVKYARQQEIRRRVKRDYLPMRTRSSRVSRTPLNDPKWPQMWYLNRGGGLDMNVQPAWKDGVTGKGVVVTILDDGLEKDHPDLVRNYDPQASYDVNNHDEDPMPRYDLIDSNRHGTRCAGEVAASANNSICAVGVAYGAAVGGVRMLDGDVTDAVEARSLSLNPQHIDIYSASWGPDDDGKTVDGPGELATRAFIEGVTKGRNGKGSIFVWASGNGGRDHDNCNCDGYTNSIWTLSISSATENGLVPWYSEACSSTLATTYSSGSSGEKQVVTTDLHHQCTASHTGTSASAPLAAGICALALEANPSLTWRDMQHIVVRTAKPANLNAPDWKVNGVGRNVSHSFGYGLMDASAMVKLARTWKMAPEQRKCEVSAPHVDKLIPAKSVLTLQLRVAECSGVNYLEHVQAKITLSTAKRGDLQIHLTSPVGTKAILLAHRLHDMSRAGFQSWPFMSVHTWGESPFGMWTLEVHNEGRFPGKLIDWNLILHGTDVLPESDTTAPTMSTNNSRIGEGGSNKNAEGSITEQANPPKETMGGQWEELIKLNNHFHNEVQRTTTEDAGSGCLALSKNGQKCIVCAEGLYLHRGRCESFCPQQYYTNFDTKGNPACLPCHYSCKACSGSNDYECKACYTDAELVNMTSTESYCYPLNLMPTIHQDRWYFWTFVAFTVNVVLILAALLYWMLSKCCCCSEKPKRRYKRLNGNLRNELGAQTNIEFESSSDDE